MGTSVRRERRRIAVLVSVLALAGGGSVAMSPPTYAAFGPGPIVQRDPTSGVTADALPTAQIDGVTWAQAINGNTVYVGGSFAHARPAGVALGGPGTVTRTNLLAYNLDTGVLISSFAPTLNGQ